MSEPLSLAARPTPAARPEPVYFVIYPEPAAAEAARRLAWRLRDKRGLRGAPIAASRLHVSLEALCDGRAATPALLDSACRAAGQVTASPFRLRFDEAASYGGPGNRPLVLAEGEGTIGVSRLRERLVQAMRAAGLPAKAARAFSPHMTLLYDETAIAPEPVEPVEWTVREFHLVRSLFGTGRRIRLGRWKLDG